VSIFIDVDDEEVPIFIDIDDEEVQIVDEVDISVGTLKTGSVEVSTTFRSIAAHTVEACMKVWVSQLSNTPYLHELQYF
jgi:hypothetical protein